jgi:hypothetical protein
MKNILKIIGLSLVIGMMTLTTSCKNEPNIPTIAPQSSQSLQRQAKLLVITAHKFGQPLTEKWCDDLKATSTEWPNVHTNTVFVLNSDMVGKKLTEVPAEMVVFFSSDTSGWNQVGPVDDSEVVALADGSAHVK